MRRTPVRRLKPRTCVSHLVGSHLVGDGIAFQENFCETVYHTCHGKEFARGNFRRIDAVGGLSITV